MLRSPSRSCLAGARRRAARRAAGLVRVISGAAPWAAHHPRPDRAPTPIASKPASCWSAACDRFPPKRSARAGRVIVNRRPPASSSCRRRSRKRASRCCSSPAVCGARAPRTRLGLGLDTARALKLLRRRRHRQRLGERRQLRPRPRRGRADRRARRRLRWSRARARSATACSARLSLSGWAELFGSSAADWCSRGNRRIVKRFTGFAFAPSRWRVPAQAPPSTSWSPLFSRSRLSRTAGRFAAARRAVLDPGANSRKKEALQEVDGAERREDLPVLICSGKAARASPRRIASLSVASPAPGRVASIDSRWAIGARARPAGEQAEQAARHVGKPHALLSSRADVGS